MIKSSGISYQVNKLAKKTHKSSEVVNIVISECKA